MVVCFYFFIAPILTNLRRVTTVIMVMVEDMVDMGRHTEGTPMADGLGMVIKCRVLVVACVP